MTDTWERGLAAMLEKDPIRFNQLYLSGAFKVSESLVDSELYEEVVGHASSKNQEDEARS